MMGSAQSGFGDRQAGDKEPVSRQAIPVTGERWNENCSQEENELLADNLSSCLTRIRELASTH